MRFITLFTLFSFFLPTTSTNSTCTNLLIAPSPQNNCISFTLGPGTGCDWMCNYCANQLGTNNYYFTDGVCSYQTGGCVGSPVTGKQYSCCSV
jgi:hypothetical protein